jgi:hypothetical protein
LKNNVVASARGKFTYVEDTPALSQRKREAIDALLNGKGVTNGPALQRFTFR